MDEEVEKIREYFCTIREAMGCYKCKKICTEPWIIRCGHNFCKTCIQDLRNLDRNCPRCVLQPITRRGVTKNEELGKLITSFHKMEDAFKADTLFDLAEDGFVPSHIIYESKNFEDSLPKTPLNNVRPTSEQDSRISTGRKDSAPETEYFRRYRNSTFRKDRIVSDKSPVRDHERSSVEVVVETLRDEEESQSPCRVPENKRLLTEEKEIRKEVADGGEEKQENEEEQNVAEDRSLRLSSHEAYRVEFDESLGEQNEEEQSLIVQDSLRLSSYISDLFQFDESLGEQNEKEQSLIVQESLRLSSHESDIVESDECLRQQNGEEQSLIVQESLRLSSHESVLVESDESLGRQNEEEQSSSHESDRVESDEGLEEQNEEEKSSIVQASLRLSSHEYVLVESDESLGEENEEEQSSSHESDRVESDEGLEKQNEEEQSSSRESHQVEDDEDEDQEEEEDDEHRIDSPEESLRSSSHVSDEIEPYEIEEISDKMETQSNTELPTVDMEIIPLENFQIPDSEQHKNKRFSPCPVMVQTVSQSNTEPKTFDESIIFLQSSSAAAKESSDVYHTVDLESPPAFAISNHTLDLDSPPAFESFQNIDTLNSNHTCDLVSPPTLDSPNVHRKFITKRKIPRRSKNVPFLKTGRLNKKRKKVLFHYSGKLSRYNKSLVDEDIVTVLSPGEMKSNLAKKSPVNRNLFDFGFKIFRGNLKPETSKVNENSLLGKRKRSVSKAKNVLENFGEDEGTQNSQVSLEKSVKKVAIRYFHKVKPARKNLEVPININQNNMISDEVCSNHSGTTEDLSDYQNKLGNNLDKQRLFRTSRNRSIISESEMTTESLSIREIVVENQKAGEKLKMQEIPSASGAGSLQAEGHFLNLDFNKKNREEERNQLQLSSYISRKNEILSQRFLSSVEDLDERPIERIRASAEDDICESFHIEKFFSFRKESQNEWTFEDGDDRVDEELILPDGGIINESVIILSSDDDDDDGEDSSKKQDESTLPLKQESTPLHELNNKTKTTQRVRHMSDNSFGLRLKKKIAKE